MEATSSDFLDSQPEAGQRASAGSTLSPSLHVLTSEAVSGTGPFHHLFESHHLPLVKTALNLERAGQRGGGMETKSPESS